VDRELIFTPGEQTARCFRLHATVDKTHNGCSGAVTAVVSSWHLIETANTTNLANSVELAEFMDTGSWTLSLLPYLSSARASCASANCWKNPGPRPPRRISPSPAATCSRRAIFHCLESTKPGAGDEIQLADALRLLAQSRAWRTVSRLLEGPQALAMQVFIHLDGTSLKKQKYKKECR
jgi:hypothetical protein